ncbi:hypothetical protein C8J56DRAFT_326419 [Mycena floridula]|nr:hypothetical protein C8J56DRAFT_326419 [Mycena floridula]
MYSDFHCNDPDFVVQSGRGGQRFPVHRDALTTSLVFRDMFFVCPASDTAVDVDEDTSSLNILLNLLHVPPKPPVPLPRIADEPIDGRIKSFDPSSMIPLPLLDLMLSLADKYILPESTKSCLEEHLSAYASQEPLRVYQLANWHNLDSAASKASQFLAPLASYLPQELSGIGADAYQKVVRLQAVRVKALQYLLKGEEIFPHGYGTCPSHRQRTMDIWEAHRLRLIWRIETCEAFFWYPVMFSLCFVGTDVAAEMKEVIEAVEGCPMCVKAATAAVEMLAYKCRRVPRKTSQLKDDE